MEATEVRHELAINDNKLAHAYEAVLVNGKWLKQNPIAICGHVSPDNMSELHPPEHFKSLCGRCIALAFKRELIPI
jgi:hypothetical protein